MYSMATNTYFCDYCEIEMELDQTSDSNGDMWECEICGTTFCTKCFLTRKGNAAFRNMMQESDKILCPDCYEAEFNNQ
jgi:ribosomal protein L37AE/L43A